MSKEKARERILGIDLGTTNSAAAIMEAGRPVTIPSAELVVPRSIPNILSLGLLFFSSLTSPPPSS